MTENNLTVGNKVTLEISSDSITEDFSAIVKRLKKQLVALTLIGEGLEPSKISVGASVRIKSSDTSPPQLINGKVMETKSFPLIIMKVEKTEVIVEDKKQSSDNNIDEIPSDDENGPHVESRDSARISDSFLIEFYFVDKEKAEEKKDDYTLRPTRYRREKAQMNTIGDGSEMTEKIAHLDSALLDVIRDIYFKISRLSGEGGDKKDLESSKEDNIGECINISGSGLQIICGKKFNKEDIVKLIIAPPNADPPFSISALAIVRNVKMEKSDKGTKYVTGVQYYAMHEEDMEEIIRYTFQLQRGQLSLRKKMQPSE